jgi:hypothetical protein
MRSPLRFGLGFQWNVARHQQIVRESPINALIRCSLAAHPFGGFVHLAPLPAGSIRRAAPSLRCVREHAILGFLKKCNDLLARDARETFQEILDRIE